MTPLLLFGCSLCTLVAALVPHDVALHLPVTTGDRFALSQKNRISAEAPSPEAAFPTAAAEAQIPEAASPEVYLATHINPTQTDCRSDCAVGLPAATVYKWQQVTITSTITVETVTHVVNPQYYPNVTGTVRSYDYPADPEETKRDRYSLDREDGVAVTSLDLGYKMLAVTFPTPVTVTPTTLTLVGGPPATESLDTPACTPAVVQSVNLTTVENAKLFTYGEAEGSIDNATTGSSSMQSQPNKSVKDTVHWRLVPEFYRQVDVTQFRNQFPYIMALDVCGAFGPPEQPASVTQLTGNAWATATVTSTALGTKDPRINPLILLSKKPGSSLDGPGARPTGGANPLTVHQEQSTQPMSSPTQNSRIALPMLTQATNAAPSPSGQLVGPAPKPATIQQQIESGSLSGSLTKPLPKPAIGVQSSGTNKNRAPMIVNGHILTPKGRGTWVVDDGQILTVGGLQIELDNSSHGDGHKMRVNINSDDNGSSVLVVDGASMTLESSDLMPAATGSSRSGGRSGGGITASLTNDSSMDDGSSDLPPELSPGMKAGGTGPVQYTGSASRTSQRWVLSVAAGCLGVIIFL